MSPDRIFTRPCLTRLLVRLPLILFALLVLAAILGSSRPLIWRTALVQAETAVLHVSFDGDQVWRIDGGARVCERRVTKEAQGAGNGVCGQFRDLGQVEQIRIANGDALEIRLEGAGMVLRIDETPREGRSPAAPCPAFAPGQKDLRLCALPRGFLRIGPEALAATGALPIAGQIVLGRAVGTGSSPDLLGGGSYEIRERNWLTIMGSNRSTVVEQGDLIPGSEVRLLEAGAPSLHSSGYVFLDTLDSGERTLRAVALSESKAGALQMSVRRTDPILVDPGMIASILANPIFAALAFLVGLLLNSVELAGKLGERSATNRDPETEDGARPNPKTRGRPKDDGEMA